MQQGATGPDDELLSVTGDMTLEAWVMPFSFPPAPYDAPIVCKYARGDGRRSYAFTYLDGSLGLAVSSDGVSFPYLSVAYALKLNSWQHVAVTYDASNGSAQFFVDGSSIGSADGGPATILSTSVGVTIGRFNDANDTIAYWDGLIDEVRIWKVVRSASDIADLRQRNVQGTESGLIAAWHFDQDYEDATAGGSSLNPTNGPGFSTSVPY